MQYSIPLSQKSIDILGNLKSPTLEQISKQRAKYLTMIGVSFEELTDKTNLSEGQIRRLLRKELYGLVGLFFGNFEGHHSHNFHQSYIDQPTYSKKMNEIHTRGNHVLFTMKGQVVEATPKRVSRHYGLYIPEQIHQDVENAIDEEKHEIRRNVDQNSLEVLDFMLKRSLDLRKKYGPNWYPYFSEKSIARDAVLPLDKVVNATYDLTGIICESYQMVLVRPWRRRLFVPSSRYKIARQLLGEEDPHAPNQANPIINLSENIEDSRMLIAA